MWVYYRVMYPKDSDRMANSADPDQRSSLIWVCTVCSDHLSRNTTVPTKWHVCPAKTQISLGIRPVWSESSLSAWRNLGSLASHCAHSEDSDQTGRMPRLIWVFAGRTCHFAGFVVWQLNSVRIIRISTVNFIWASSRENLALGVCDQVRLKPACSATESS